MLHIFYFKNYFHPPLENFLEPTKPPKKFDYLDYCIVSRCRVRLFSSHRPRRKMDGNPVLIVVIRAYPPNLPVLRIGRPTRIRRGKGQLIQWPIPS